MAKALQLKSLQTLSTEAVDNLVDNNAIFHHGYA